MDVGRLDWKSAGRNIYFILLILQKRIPNVKSDESVLKTTFQTLFAAS